MTELEKGFKVWCKETKRNGGVLVGSSIREFFEWYENVWNSWLPIVAVTHIIRDNNEDISSK